MKRVRPRLVTRRNQYEDLANRRFGKLVVLNLCPDNIRQLRWVCMCDCGKTTIAYGSNLKSRKTRSCGCARTTHNRSYTDLYHSWHTMRRRCRSNKAASYKYYGGKGIQVCKRWDSFENFLEDMGERPPGKTLDRISNDGDYCKENCRWATAKEQRLNSGYLRNITIDGLTLCITDWCRKFNITYISVTKRLKKGWPIEKALSTPMHERYRKNVVNA